MSAPLVSVIVPCFNAARWLGETLDCLAGQTHSHLEIIAVDDGSTDSTGAVLAACRDPRLRVLRQSNRGAATARNLGIGEARGEYLQFLDADDLMAPSKIAVQLAAVAELEPGWVAGARWGRFRRSIHDARFEQAWSRPRQRGIDWLVNAWSTGDMMPPLGWLVPRSVAAAAGAWNPAAGINDDGEYFNRVLLKCAGVVQIPEAIVYYRSGNTSYSQRTDHWAWESMLNSYELCARQMLQAENSPRVKTAVTARLQNFQYLAYPRFPDLVDRTEALLQALGLPKGTPHGGGPASRIVGRILGWKVSRRLGIATAAVRGRPRKGWP